MLCESDFNALKGISCIPTSHTGCGGTFVPYNTRVAFQCPDERRKKSASARQNGKSAILLRQQYYLYSGKFRMELPSQIQGI